ncbi:hypothetical protein ACGF7W_20115 [Streptomyces sp. NPDC048219]|uniref:hypothetical protein n=1 Tax=Streptomyces sp. NPDC048219 TaxID=3365517 RepID=UPI003711F050
MAKPATVDLTKTAPTVSLHKHGVTSGLIKVNLNWTSPQVAARRTTGDARGLSVGSGHLCGRPRPGKWISTSDA